MNGVVLAQLLLSALVLAVCWFCYQLFLQNGRLLFRLEALEQELQTQGTVPNKEIDILKGMPEGSLLNDFELPLLKGGSCGARPQPIKAEVAR